MVLRLENIVEEWPTLLSIALGGEGAPAGALERALSGAREFFQAKKSHANTGRRSAEGGGDAGAKKDKDKTGKKDGDAGRGGQGDAELWARLRAAAAAGRRGERTDANTDAGGEGLVPAEIREPLCRHLEYVGTQNEGSLRGNANPSVTPH